MQPTDLPPWKRKKPTRGKSAPLTAEQKAAAKQRAQAAGRRYPNLIDNMWAARHVAPSATDGSSEDA